MDPTLLESWGRFLRTKNDICKREWKGSIPSIKQSAAYEKKRASNVMEAIHEAVKFEEEDDIAKWSKYLSITDHRSRVIPIAENGCKVRVVT